MKQFWVSAASLRLRTWAAFGSHHGDTENHVKSLCKILCGALFLCGSRLLFAAAILMLAVPAAAQQAVFVVRHGERADTAGGAAPMMANDPDLSEAGKARAQSLASALKDAGITAIYTTEYKRTRQTAEPLAKALGLDVTVVPARDMSGLIEKVQGATGNVLVIGHSNSVGDVIAKLGAVEPVKLEDSDYDKLFIVVKGEKPVLLRLHFR
jgi:broad specificity phosphatase PhoE